MNPHILTARPDTESQSFFDEQRKKYFPSERNLLNAHLTLFHKFPCNPLAEAKLQTLVAMVDKPMPAKVFEIRNIGYGVAYFIKCLPLETLHHNLGAGFENELSGQDRQKFQPHITIQNKVHPQEAKKLFVSLTQSFEPFDMTITGLDLWFYLNGPWKHDRYYPFQ